MTVPRRLLRRSSTRPAPTRGASTTRWYEQRKYAVTLAALPQRRYATAYEPGCSIGVLTAPARRPLRRAARQRRLSRCRRAGARARRGASARDRRAALAARGVARRLVRPRGALRAAVLPRLRRPRLGADRGGRIGHARRHAGRGALAPSADDHPLPTDEVHARLLALAGARGLDHVVHHLEDEFVLDVVVRLPADDPAMLPRPSGPR